jgi:hypothetical protein
VTTDDKWHIGSCTKSMTAALGAMLVEDGTLRWDMTLAEVFPEMEADMQAGWRDVTLEQLLAHHGGAPGDLDADGLWGRLWQRVDQPPRTQREYLTRELLTKHKPVAPPGTKYIYSNAGYAIIGHAIEEALDRPWEDLLREGLCRGHDFSRLRRARSVAAVDQPGATRQSMPSFRAGCAGLTRQSRRDRSGRTVHCRIGDLADMRRGKLRAREAQAHCCTRDSRDCTCSSAPTASTRSDGWPRSVRGAAARS